MNMKYTYTGIENRMVKFVEQKQLKDRALWKLVSSQFAGFPDAGDCGWRGEYWGKLMRGACMVYQYTQDAELYEILTETLCDMLKNAEKNGRISTYAGNPEFTGWDMWCRKYVLLGFLHFYDICMDSQLKSKVLSAMQGHLDYIIAHIGEGKTNICDTSPVWQGVNSSSILEPVVMLYNITGEKRYMDFADHIVNSGGAKEYNIFETAYENKLKPFECPVTKAYELMSCFEGLIEYYKVTKIEKWKTAAQNFVQQIIDTEITIIGCAGCEHECFNNSALMQTYSKYDGLMQETCVTVTWMKLCAKLLGLTGNSVYADEIEKSAYNALYGAVNTDGSINNSDTVFDLSWFRDVHRIHTEKYGAQPFDSYSPLTLGTRGRAIGGFRPLADSSVYSGCCIAIGAAGLALVPLVSVIGSDTEVVFNLYPEGRVECDGFGAELRSAYPTDGDVTICVDCDTQKTIKLRIPHFAREFSVKLNGEDLSYCVAEGYAVIDSNLHSGDIIAISFDMNPRVQRGMHNPDDAKSENYAAFFYGPLVLARDARFGQVGGTIRLGDVSFKKIETAGINSMCAFEVDTGKEVIKMVDYASAGKTWDKTSEMEAWIEVKN